MRQVTGQCDSLTFRLDTQDSETGIPEVLAVFVGVEADQVGAEHASQDLFPGGQRAIGLV